MVGVVAVVVLVVVVVVLSEGVCECSVSMCMTEDAGRDM